MTRVLDVVRCHDGLEVERDWIFKLLLSDFELRFHDGKDLDRVIPGALYVAIGSYGLGFLPEALLKKIEACGDCGLLHLGDEFFRGPHKVYASFAYVIRNCWASFFEAQGVLQIPQGYSPNLNPPKTPKPASTRAYAWSFMGLRTASRGEMIERFSDFSPNFVDAPGRDDPHGSKTSREDYLRILADSAFFPAPIGNVLIETMRPYEALEYGAIPILPLRKGLRTFEAFYGAGHPLAAFATWAEARDWAETLYQHPDDLDALQQTLVSWWAEEKKRQTARVTAFIDGARAGAHRQALKARFGEFSNARLQPARVAELLKHHDFTALRGRAALAGRRALAMLKNKIG